jgi:hypothetical protein
MKMGFCPTALSLLAFCAWGSAIHAQSEVDKFTGLDSVSNDQFGKQVSIDGTTLAVGAYQSANGGTGAVYVFELQGGLWVEVQKLLASDGAAGDELGNSVEISGDTIVAGSEFADNGAGANSGTAYVFEKVGDTWIETARLAPLDAQSQHHFAESITLDGDVIVVGARQDADNGNNSGAAYVFERMGGEWMQTAKLVPADSDQNDLTGDQVAVSGTTAIIGSRRNDEAGNNVGAAYVFEKVGGTWVETQKLLPSGGTAGEFSRGVSIDGDTAVIGSWQDSVRDAGAGAAYVFERQNGTWIQTAVLTGSDLRAGDTMGYSVDISGDRIVAGADKHDDLGTDSGTAYVFERQNGVWVETAELLGSSVSFQDWYGHWVSISGSSVLVSAPRDVFSRGTAYVFDLDLPPGGGGDGTVVSYGEGSGGANIGTLSTASIPNEGNAMTFSVSGIPSGTTGIFWISSTQTSLPFLGGTLLSDFNTASVRIGFAMSGGMASVPYTVPLGTAGVVVYAQAGARDATQSQGVALTNGLEITVGSN